MNLKKIAKERSFLKGYLMYMKVENPLFKEYSKKFDEYDNILREERRKNPYFDADW